MPGLAAVATSAAFSHRDCCELDDALADLAWSDDGRRLIAGSARGSLYHLDAQGCLQRAWVGHEGGITRIRLQPGNGATLASAGEDGRVKLWDLSTGDAPRTLVEQRDWVEHLAWAPDGSVLAAAARKTISLWRGTESLGMWYDARRHVLGMAWAPGGRRLATAGNKGLFLWRLDQGSGGDVEPVQLLGFPGAPVSVAWQPNGSALAVGTQDGFLQLWRPSSASQGAKQLTMRGYPSKVACLAWHPRNAVIATAGGPDVVLWELPPNGGGARGKPLRRHQSTITALAWSSDGELLASGDRSGRLCLWDTQGDAVFSRRLGYEVAALHWQPDQHRLAVGDTAGRLHLIDRPGDTTSRSTGSSKEEMHP